MEERTAEEAKQSNEIVYVKVELQGVPAEMMIGTGANISLIDLSLIHIFWRAT